jgi:hypothetical protein
LIEVKVELRVQLNKRKKGLNTKSNEEGKEEKASDSKSSRHMKVTVEKVHFGKELTWRKARMTRPRP